MSDTFREQIEAIDNGRDATMELVARTIQPLARVSYLLLRTLGTDSGWWRKKREARFGKILIRRVGGRYSSEVEVLYEGKLVLHFDDHLSWISHIDRGDKRKYLFFYSGGEWQQAVVDEYQKTASINLRQNFDVDGAWCIWYDTDIGFCSKYKDPVCPCTDYKEE